MDAKIFEFKTTVCGFEKNFRVHGKNYTEARQKLDAHILSSVKVLDHKDVTPKEDFNVYKDIFDGFADSFKDIFGPKK